MCFERVFGQCWIFETVFVGGSVVSVLGFKEVVVIVLGLEKLGFLLL